MLRRHSMPWRNRKPALNASALGADRDQHEFAELAGRAEGGRVARHGGVPLAGWAHQVERVERHAEAHACKEEGSQQRRRKRRVAYSAEGPGVTRRWKNQQRQRCTTGARPPARPPACPLARRPAPARAPMWGHRNRDRLEARAERMM